MSDFPETPFDAPAPETAQPQAPRSRPSFQYVSPTQEQIDLMQVFRDEYQALYEKLSGLTPSRGLSLAKTHLEESSMWLNKAITQND